MFRSAANQNQGIVTRDLLVSFLPHSKVLNIAVFKILRLSAPALSLSSVCIQSTKQL
jgi:hypothetical protein